MAAMNVSLTPQILAFVNDLVKAGGYASASKVVVQDGLRLLESQQAVAAGRQEILRRDVEAGLADVQGGRFSDRTATQIARNVIRNSGRAP